MAYRCADFRFPDAPSPFCCFFSVIDYAIFILLFHYADDAIIIRLLPYFHALIY